MSARHGDEGRSAVELGVDLGTSSTVAFLRRGGGPPEPVLFDGAPLLPSAIYADDDGRLIVGRDAVHAARAHPERFEGNPKRRIDDGTVLLGAEVTVEALLGGLLHRVVTEARRTGGTAVTGATICHPAAWGPARRATLLRAAAAAGLDPGAVRLVPEPVAAAAFHLRRHGPADADLLVYDLGAGTFDVAVVRPGGAGTGGAATGGAGTGGAATGGAGAGGAAGLMEVLCSAGLDETGGQDIDAAIVDLLRRRSGAPQLWARLDNPATTADQAARRQLWDDVRAAKEMLSRTSSAQLSLPLLGTAQIITLEDLEGLAAPLIQRTVDAVAATLADCPVPLRPLGAVILVGGATRMPLVATMLHRALGIAPTVIDQPELVVAEGSIDPMVTGLPHDLDEPPSAADRPTAPAGPVPTGPVPVSGGGAPGPVPLAPPLPIPSPVPLPPTPDSPQRQVPGPAAWQSPPPAPQPGPNPALQAAPQPAPYPAPYPAPQAAPPAGPHPASPAGPHPASPAGPYPASPAGPPAGSHPGPYPASPAGPHPASQAGPPAGSHPGPYPAPPPGPHPPAPGGWQPAAPPPGWQPDPRSPQWQPTPPPQQQWAPAPPPQQWTPAAPSQQWTPAAPSQQWTPPSPQQWAPPGAPPQQWAPGSAPQQQWAPGGAPQQQWAPAPPPSQRWPAGPHATPPWQQQPGGGDRAALTNVEVIEIITPLRQGVTLRGQLYGGYDIIEHVFPADADGRLLVFGDTAALARYAARDASDRLVATPPWQVRNDGADERRFDLDLLIEHLSGPPQRWLPSFVCRCRDLCAQLTVYLEVQGAGELLGEHSTIDRVDDVLRRHLAVATVGRGAQRRLARIDRARLVRDWTDLIALIDESTVTVE